MKYFFVLGKNQALSLAELAAVFGQENVSRGKLCQGGVLVMDLADPPEMHSVIRGLGGTIKIGPVIDALSPEELSIDSLLPKLESVLAGRGGKFRFGLSVYGKIKLNSKDLAMGIKRYLRAQGVSSRWVTSKEPVLSSVVVSENKLTDPGIELVFLRSGSQVLLARTEVVQPYKELSFRDYGRPARDDRSGMLPPKLAQVMINLAQAKWQDLLWDPFCGSGTILTEAALMGYKRLGGSDMSEQAVTDTRQNLEWTKEKFAVGPEAVIRQTNILGLPQELKKRRIGAIVSEGYLGPQRGGFDLARTVAELEELYTKSLEVFSRVAKPGGRVVLAWPQIKGEFLFASGLKLPAGIEIEKPLPEQFRFLEGYTARQTLLYKRPQQKVGREILVLKTS